jgi:superfamily II DNA or RNA helicase
MQLRDYQKRALDEIKRRFDHGVRRQILSLPTGLGKTVIFTWAHKVLNFQKRVLVIAHRAELVQQAVRHYQEIGYKFGNERTDTWYRNVSTDKKIWIGTVQSLTHRKSRRVERLSPKDFDLVICDEAHHSIASTYLSVCSHFGITTKQFKGLFLGVTATPMRNDGRSLDKLFDDVVCVMDTFSAIRDGWLVDIKYLQAHSRISIDDLQMGTSGDFNSEALGRRINEDHRNSLIFKAWKEKARDKRTIVFCASVEHAANVAKTFKAHKVYAEAIHGRLSQEKRSSLLEQHREGTITVLANCEILTEGYDDPNIECIIMARPTQSQPLYIQMVGRGLRLPRGIENLKKAKREGALDPAAKTECIIIDVVDNCTRHDMEVVTALSLFGESIEDAAALSADRAAVGTLVPPDGRAPKPEVFEAVKPDIREIDLFANRTRPLWRRNGIRQPQQLKEGPLARWREIRWEEQYKKDLHRKIVVLWKSVSDGSRFSFKRLDDAEYGAAISCCDSGRWTLTVKATNGTPYSRTFVNLFDAFGCAEYFVFDEKGEIDRPGQTPRLQAVLPIQKHLLQIYRDDHEVQTFGQAQQRIVRCMKST